MALTPLSRVLSSWGGPGSGRPKATRQSAVETGRPGPWGVPWHRVLWAQPEIHVGKRMRAPPFPRAPSHSTIRAQPRVPEWSHFRPVHSNGVCCVSRHPGSCFPRDTFIGRSAHAYHVCHASHFHHLQPLIGVHLYCAPLAPRISTCMRAPSDKSIAREARTRVSGDTADSIRVG